MRLTFVVIGGILLFLGTIPGQVADSCDGACQGVATTTVVVGGVLIVAALVSLFVWPPGTDFDELARVRAERRRREADPTPDD